jgi:hypothetical protein
MNDSIDSDDFDIINAEYIDVYPKDTLNNEKTNI